MLIVIGFVIMLYILAAFATYGFAVFKTFEYTGIWSFKMEKEHIGICKYPKWLMGWMYWIGVKWDEIR